MLVVVVEVGVTGHLVEVIRRLRPPAHLDLRPGLWTPARPRRGGDVVNAHTHVHITPIELMSVPVFRHHGNMCSLVPIFPHLPIDWDGILGHRNSVPTS